MAKLIRFITIEEFKIVLSKEKDKRFKLAYVLGFGSGLRISEIIGLKEVEPTKDLQLNKYSWKIKPIIAEQINLNTHQIRIFGKGGKERITVASKWLKEEHLKLLPLKINRRTLQRRFTIICKNVLKKDLTFHTLRHGFANYMANERSVPLPMVQQMLGHSRLDTTGIYTKANPIQTITKAWESF